MSTALPITIAALYRFASFDNPGEIAEGLRAAASLAGTKGSLLVAPEGLNGTIAGTGPAIAGLISHIRTLPDCADIEVKYSAAATVPFQRMKVRLKREIVTMGIDGIDAARKAGERVSSAQWNALIADPDTVVIDTRNAYEVAMGSFTKANSPQTSSFREFPAWFDDFSRTLESGKAPKIAMFCTGGIRCEKATAYVKERGFDQVYHLDGGILKYLEETPVAHSLWQGECYVFDERVTVTHDLTPGSHGACKPCGHPLTSADIASPLYEAGARCPHCAGKD